MSKIVLVAGATGDLGIRIAGALLKRGAEVRTVVRPATAVEKIKELESIGVKVYKVNNWTVEELKDACTGVSCVVSALAGLRDVIIDAQKVLADAAINACVPRFIPSDYSLDFTRFTNGENRNLDLRREFHQYIGNKPIATTTIFNGAFAELLTGEMPTILFKQKMVMYWGDADRGWDFTTKDDTAVYTANAALDHDTPRYLRIAGDRISPRELRTVVGNVTGQKFKLIRAGGQGLLGLIIKIARKFSPGQDELYPAWQGMQYMHNMIDKRSKVDQLDNHRYPGMHWTTVKELLQKHQRSN
jgi:nucleoside-diphosphate-sugar epimerase